MKIFNNYLTVISILVCALTSTVACNQQMDSMVATLGQTFGFNIIPDHKMKFKNGKRPIVEENKVVSVFNLTNLNANFSEIIPID